MCVIYVFTSYEKIDTVNFQKFFRRMGVIDIKGNSTDPVAARLSNFTTRSFIFDGRKCSGMEGFLQSLKSSDLVIQKYICSLNGKEAMQAGQDYNDWKKLHILWWNGNPYSRFSREYYNLITRAYDSLFDQDESFKGDLLALGSNDVCHSIGNTDMRDTVLTEVEMIHHLNRLRIKALFNR